MDERKSHYNPGQFGAYLKVQLVSGRQTRRGWFRSLDALRGALPAAYVRHVAFLLSEGDLVVDLTGAVYVDGWEEWQEGDLTVGERMSRLRNRRRNGTVTGGVTPTVTQPSPPAIGVGIGVGVSTDEGSTRPSTSSGARANGRHADPIEDDETPLSPAAMPWE